MGEVYPRKRMRKDGSYSWEYRFECAPINGKRQSISKSGFKTKSEALAAGRIAQKEYEAAGEKVTISEISFADYLDYWIEHDCMIDLKESTVKSYKKKIELYIKPELGKFKLRAIKRQQLQDFIMKQFNAGFSRNSLVSLKGILTKCFNYAYDNEMILGNPSMRLKIPKNQTPEVQTRAAPHVYIPKERMKEIFERFPEGHPSHLPLMLGYKCGLRLGEVFGLCWEDIDFEKKTLSVNRQVQWYADRSRSAEEKQKANGTSESGGGYWYFSPPKYDSYRVINLDDDLVNLLIKTKNHIEECKKFYKEFYVEYFSDLPLNYSGAKPVVDVPKNKINLNQGNHPVHFINIRDSGEYVTSRTMQNVSRVIHTQINFPEFDFHSLRHTHATMLAENGAPMKYVQNRLGHSKIEMTMGIYAHLTEKMTDEGNDILEEMFK